MMRALLFSWIVVSVVSCGTQRQSSSRVDSQFGPTFGPSSFGPSRHLEELTQELGHPNREYRVVQLQTGNYLSATKTYHKIRRWIKNQVNFEYAKDNVFLLGDSVIIAGKSSVVKKILNDFKDVKIARSVVINRPISLYNELRLAAEEQQVLTVKELIELEKEWVSEGEGGIDAPYERSLKKIANVLEFDKEQYKRLSKLFGGFDARRKFDRMVLGRLVEHVLLQRLAKRI